MNKICECGHEEGLHTAGEESFCIETKCKCVHYKEPATSGDELKKLSFWDGLLEAEKASLRFFVEQARAEERTKLVGLVKQFEREEVPYLYADDADQHKQNLNLHNSLRKLIATLESHQNLPKDTVVKD